MGGLKQLRSLGTSGSDSAGFRVDRTLLTHEWLACGTRRLSSCRPWVQGVRFQPDPDRVCVTEQKAGRGHGEPVDAGTAGYAASPAPTAAAAAHEKKHSSHRAATQPTDVTALHCCSGGHPQRKGAF